VANPSDNAALVAVELIAASGEVAGSTLVSIPPAGQFAAFVREIPGLLPLTYFEGMLRLTTASPQGVAVMGLRGRYNERGDFLITSTPPAEQIHPSANVFPHIVDGGGYATQFVFLRTDSSQAGVASVRFAAQNGQALEVSLR
jgi:hypothetical protein